MNRTSVTLASESLPPESLASESRSDHAPLPVRAFLLTALLAAIWINASEVARYLLVVMPMMRAALPSVDGVAPMDLGVFAIWGVWDTLLVLVTTLFVWLHLARFGRTVAQALLAGTLVWAAVFVILWLALFNMNLAPGDVVAAALPLAWLELAVAALVVRWGMNRFAPA